MTKYKVHIRNGIQIINSVVHDNLMPMSVAHLSPPTAQKETLVKLKLLMIL